MGLAGGLRKAFLRVQAAVTFLHLYLLPALNPTRSPLRCAWRRFGEARKRDDDCPDRGRNCVRGIPLVVQYGGHSSGSTVAPKTHTDGVWSPFRRSPRLAVYGLACQPERRDAVRAPSSHSPALSAIWGWHELSFLTGLISGPRTIACPPDASGWRRFIMATSTLVYHETRARAHRACNHRGLLARPQSDCILDVSDPVL